MLGAAFGKHEKLVGKREMGRPGMRRWIDGKFSTQLSLEVREPG
jgi:hypothetical protein